MNSLLERFLKNSTIAVFSVFCGYSELCSSTSFEIPASMLHLLSYTAPFPEHHPSGHPFSPPVHPFPPSVHRVQTLSTLFHLRNTLPYLMEP